MDINKARVVPFRSEPKLVIFLGVLLSPPFIGRGSRIFRHESTGRHHFFGVFYADNRQTIVSTRHCPSGALPVGFLLFLKTPFLSRCRSFPSIHWALPFGFIYSYWNYVQKYHKKCHRLICVPVPFGIVPFCSSFHHSAISQNNSSARKCRMIIDAFGDWMDVSGTGGTNRNSATFDSQLFFSYNSAKKIFWHWHRIGPSFLRPYSWDTCKLASKNVTYPRTGASTWAARNSAST